MAFKSRGWRATPFLFMVVALEQAAAFSIGINLFTFVFNLEHFSLSTSANIVTNFMGTTFLLNLLGGFVSDVWWSRINTILVSGAIETLGLLLMVLTASLDSLRPPECPPFSPLCKVPNSHQKLILFGGLYLIALGAGGVKGNLAAMGADQFDSRDEAEQKELGSYFNAYFFHFCLGALAAMTGLVYIQEHISFKVGYLIALSSMVMALTIAISAYQVFKNPSAHRKDEISSPLVSFAQVLVASVRNRNVPQVSPDMLHERITDEKRSYRLPHTDQFKFLDKAAAINYNNPPSSQSSTSPWRLCTVTQVEEVKIVSRILPIFATTIALNCVIAQVQTVSLQQGRSMDRKISSSFEIPPASVAALPVLFMIVMLPIYDRLLVPAMRRVTGLESGITHLQRISVGLVLAIVSMVVAVFVEKKRLHVAEENNLLDQPQATVPLKIYWIMIQYSILGFADIFTFVGLIEFFYREAPERIRSMSTSLSFVSLSMGYFLSSVLVSIVQKVTTRDGSQGWLPNNINRGNLSNFYWLLAVISAVNFILYLICAKWYRYRTQIQEEIHGPELKSSEAKSEVGSVSMRPLIVKSVPENENV